jgi:hypothetical protein
MGLLPVSAADYVDLVPTYESIDVLARAKWLKIKNKIRMMLNKYIISKNNWKNYHYNYQ